MKHIKNYRIFESMGKTFMGITLGDLLSEGTESIVFNIEGEPDKIIKINHYLYKRDIEPGNYSNENEPTDFGSIMKDYPSIFVKVFQHGIGYAVLEKIDTAEVDEEFNQMGEFYELNYPDMVDEHPFDMNFDKDDVDDFFPVLKKLMSCDNPIIKDLSIKWFNFFMYTYKVFNGFPDLNFGNYGYDKQGNIKLCDY